MWYYSIGASLHNNSNINYTLNDDTYSLNVEYLDEINREYK